MKQSIGHLKQGEVIICQKLRMSNQIFAVQMNLFLIHLYHISPFLHFFFTKRTQIIMQKCCRCLFSTPQCMTSRTACFLYACSFNINNKQNSQEPVQPVARGRHSLQAICWQCTVSVKRLIPDAWTPMSGTRTSKLRVSVDFI